MRYSSQSRVKRGSIVYVTVYYQSLSPHEFSVLCPSLVDVYIKAMGYDPAMKNSRITAWRAAVMEKNFHAVLAHNNTHILGVAYGYLGRPEHWWDREVRRALRLQGGASPRQLNILSQYFSVTEIHVSPQAQGKGIGTQLLSSLIAKSQSEHILLSTPEVAGEDNGAFRLYRRFGFEDFVRQMLFAGDERPFAILHATASSCP
ncbi:GNAT family N-acetyltransferase [Corynebacterium felinum]|uniref:GNAT family N-acetyltransferase n=1 Tax=Corynebacterium felinum TaxID=131318 RepID=UPI00286A9C25|nr:GNAT family N-acetyltransferase [Corynebacterium felinum]